MAEETKIKEDTVTVPVAQGDLDATSNAEFYNPHGVLGGHLGIGKHADTATIRVLRPLAKSVTILTQDGEYPMTHEYNGVFVVTVPASGTKKQPTIPDYRVRTEWESGAVLIEDDPYRYMPTVGDMTPICSARAVTRSSGRRLARMCCAMTIRWRRRRHARRTGGRHRILRVGPERPCRARSR